MIKFTVLYPSQPDGRFDFEYYTTKHVELFRSAFAAAGIENIVVERGVSGAMPGAPAPFVCLCQSTVRDPQKFGELLAKHAPELMADTANFTNIRPTLQLGEVLGG